MAEPLLTIEEVARQLQITKDQVIELVKKGVLRAFLDQKTYKFRAADVEIYKKKIVNNVTTLQDDTSKGEGTEVKASVPPRKDATSKIDLAEIDAEPGPEDADQTSVMAPVDEGEEARAKTEAAPVFQFSEKDLGIKKEEPEEEQTPEEGDQTSLLAPPEPEEAGKAEVKPTLDFAEKDLKLPLDEEPGESVLVADESESSVDILEVAEESSSESASSASNIILSDESSSGEEVAAVAEVEETPKPAAAPPTEKAVSDILGPATEESEEELETLDLDEVVETQGTAETIVEEAPAEPAKKADSTETVPVSDEYETVGVAVDETRVTEAEATAAVSEAVAEAIEAVAPKPEEEEEKEPEAGPVLVQAGWETVVPSRLFNGVLIAAIILLAVAGAFLICEVFGVRTGLTSKVVEFVKSQSWL